MINCKADLMNTHVDNVDGELKKAFIESCNKHGVTLAMNIPCDSAKYLEAFSYGMCYTNIPENGRKLTIEDFKKTKVEYVQCIDTIFNLRKDFEDGDLYTKIHKHDFDCMIKITCSHVLSCNLYDEVAYRRVETEVTWLDELADKYPVHIQGDIIELTVTEFHKDTFAEMCSFVHNANK